MEEMQALSAKEKKTVEEVVAEFFQNVGVEGTTTLTFDEQELSVLLDTDDSGIVIGYHGEVLEALQLLLSLVIAKKLDRFLRVSIEVGDYKKNREAYLQNLALKTKERALSEQTEQVISSLRSWERRVVHLFLQDDTDVTTESVGEGRDRVLVVKPNA